MRQLIVGALCSLSFAASAAERPPLPAAAKQLSAAEIVKTMNGKTFKYVSYSKADVKTGETSFDFKKMKFWGTYDGKKYKPLPLSMNGNGYCYEEVCEKGLSVYSDGKSLYEVNSDGNVNSILTR